MNSLARVLSLSHSLSLSLADGPFSVTHWTILNFIQNNRTNQNCWWRRLPSFCCRFSWTKNVFNVDVFNFFVVVVYYYFTLSIFRFVSDRDTVAKLMMCSVEASLWNWNSACLRIVRLGPPSAPTDWLARTRANRNTLWLLGSFYLFCGCRACVCSTFGLLLLAVTDACIRVAVRGIRWHAWRINSIFWISTCALH